MKNALIIYAHPEPRSFNAALCERAGSVLSEGGYEVAVSDLYAQDFSPLLDRHDFSATVGADYFKPQAEQMQAAADRSFAVELQAEMDKLEKADLLIFQFPLWWFGLPAILKGWVDRVFAMGFAYGPGIGNYSRGRFKGRKAMLSLSTGGPLSHYAEDGLSGALDVVLWPIQNGMLNFTGFSVLPPFVAPGPARIGDNERAALLTAWEARLRSIDETRPLNFHDLDDFDLKGPEPGRLKPGITGRTVGQRSGL
jgi:NAD(P)H dehydrogenase (quinone)